VPLFLSYFIPPIVIDKSYPPILLILMYLKYLIDNKKWGVVGIEPACYALVCRPTTTYAILAYGFVFYIQTEARWVPVIKGRQQSS